MKFPTTTGGVPARWRDVSELRSISTQGKRSAKLLTTVISQFDVEHQARYQRTPTETYCNIFATDVIAAMGVVAPRHWADPDTGMPTPVGTGSELSANKMFVWFEDHGADFGWIRVTEGVAATYALAGKPAVAIWRNPNARASGHVAILVPSSPVTMVAQAGARNFERTPLASAFGVLRPSFWAHE